MPACHKCARALVESDYGRQERCPGCGFATRVCLNCLYYDPSRYNECSETIADRVVEKDKANFCDHFKASDPKNVTGPTAAEKARAAAEALFKKGK